MALGDPFSTVLTIKPALCSLSAHGIGVEFGLRLREHEGVEAQMRRS